MRPRLLDLFCGAGGAAMGYHRAGFDVVGVDINPQPNYPFEFVQADALTPIQAFEEHLGFDFDAIHASPPCQAFTAMKTMANRREHADLLTPTRKLLQQTDLPWVIENVPGAPMETVFRLCGTSFGLGVEAYDGWRQLIRHRYFESTFPMLAPSCRHEGSTIGFYGDHARDRRRRGENGKALDFPDRDKVRLAQHALDMPWTDSWNELKEAIPPAYTEFIAHQLLSHIKVAA